MAGTPGTSPAVAATLGCIESTIDALADAIDHLRDHAATASQDDSASPTDAARRRVAEQCDEAVRTLRIARDMTGGIRERVGPALAAR